MKNKIVNPMVTAAEECLAEQLAAASTATIKKKLNNLAQVCRDIVGDSSRSLSIAEVARDYKKRFPQNPLSEQTIRNQRPGGNPYLTLVRAWHAAAAALQVPPISARQNDGRILAESDLHKIKDQVLRHQVTQLFAQNRSLHNRLNLLKNVLGKEKIRVADTANRQITSGAEGLVLTGAELDSIRDFVDPKKMKAKHLKQSISDGVTTVDGHAVADPGFMSALIKIVKSYEFPEH